MLFNTIENIALVWLVSSQVMKGITVVPDPPGRVIMVFAMNPAGASNVVVKSTGIDCASAVDVAAYAKPMMG